MKLALSLSVVLLLATRTASSEEQCHMPPESLFSKMQMASRGKDYSGKTSLGAFLLPIRDNVTLTGCVVSDRAPPEIAVSAPALSFTVDDFLARRPPIANGADGDFFFFIEQLDRESKQRLLTAMRCVDQLYPQPPGHSSISSRTLTYVAHLELVAFAETTDKKATLFPGWKEAATHAVTVDGRPITERVTCAQEGGPPNDPRCVQPLVDGKPILGRRVTATGLFVVDCGLLHPGNECSATQDPSDMVFELHPVYAIKLGEPCNPDEKLK
jgi:hypothetical protein